MKELTLEKYTEILSSKEPVPGGGGASSVVASIAMSLGLMVGNLTIGKKAYENVEDDIKDIMVKSEILRKRFLELSEEDAKCFEPLSKAYAIPKEDPNKVEIMEEALKVALKPPFEILKATTEAIDLFKEYMEKGSKFMASDTATGVSLCYGAMLGAAMNVKVNTKLMKDKAYAEELNYTVDKLVDKYSDLASSIFEEIYMRY